MTARTSLIQHDRIGGVTVLRRPDLEGPTHAALLFRVGVVDEPLPHRGVSHLVEHLALSSLGQEAFPYNGFVDFTVTGMHCEGTPEQVGAFLSRVCAALTDLPLGRADAERRILRTEHRGRVPSLAEYALSVRYGPNGYGLHGYEEFALAHSDTAFVRTWSRRHYGRGNALLWIAGEPPGQLHLPLDGGGALAQPPPAPELHRTPVWVPIEPPGIAVSMVVPRSPAALALARHLERLLGARLRHEEGLAYAPQATYQQLDTDYAHLFVTVDALEDTAAAVNHHVVAVLAELAEGRGLTADALDADRLAMRSLPAWAETPRAHAELDAVARATLAGRPVETFDELMERYAAVTAADIANELRAGLSSALYLLGGVPSPPKGLDCPQLEWPDGLVRGRRYWGMIRDGVVPGLRHPALVAGDEGVSLVLEHETLTVRFADLRALRVFADGPRQLIAADGTTLFVDPRDWELGHWAVQLIDERVPRELRVPAGPSGLDAVRRRYRLSNPVLVLVLAFGLLMTAGVVAASLDELVTTGRLVDLPRSAAMTLAVLVGLVALPARQLWRRRGQPR